MLLCCVTSLPPTCCAGARLMSVPSCPKRLNRCLDPTALVTPLAAVHPSARPHIPVTLVCTGTSLPLYLLVESNVHPLTLLHILQLGQHHTAVCNSSRWLEPCFAQIAFVMCMGTTADVQYLQQLHKSLHLQMPLPLARPAVFQLTCSCHWLNFDNSCLCYS